MGALIQDQWSGPSGPWNFNHYLKAKLIEDQPQYCAAKAAAQTHSDKQDWPKQAMGLLSEHLKLSPWHIQWVEQRRGIHFVCLHHLGLRWGRYNLTELCVCIYVRVRVWDVWCTEFSLWLQHPSDRTGAKAFVRAFMCMCWYLCLCVYMFLGARVVSKQENKDQGNRSGLERKREIRGSKGGIERWVLSLLCSLPSARWHRQHVGYNEEACISVHVAPKLAGACPVCLALVFSYFPYQPSKNVYSTKTI